MNKFWRTKETSHEIDRNHPTKTILRDGVEHEPNLSVVNISQPQPQTTYERNSDCMDDFWQQVAKFVFDVSNLLFPEVLMLQTDTDKQW